MKRKVVALLGWMTLSLAVPVVLHAAPPTLTLAVDASEAARGLLHARLTVPAAGDPWHSSTRSGCPASTARPGR